MEKIDKFNVRVYGLLVHEHQLMVLKEPYAGEILYKFPGGGVEFGEGLTACLDRELQEELNLKLKSHVHFYTQESFLASKFRENEQLLTIYYLIEVEDISSLKILDTNIEALLWIPLEILNPDHVNLPIDQYVVEKFITEKVKIQP